MYATKVKCPKYINLTNVILLLFIYFSPLMFGLPLSIFFAEFMHSSVRYIEMSNTHLQSVDDETFQGLRLKTLKLIDNELQDISERSFR